MSHPPNYVFVLFGLLLVTTGWWWQRGKTRLIVAAWALFLAVGISILVFIPPALNPLAFTADELPSQTGVKDGESRVATEPENKEGYLISASFTALPARRYEVDLEYESSGEPGEPTARWEIVTDAGKTVVADGVLPPSTANMDRFNHKLVVSELPSLGKMVMEFRVLYPSQGSLRVERLTITPLSVAED